VGKGARTDWPGDGELEGIAHKRARLDAGG